MPDWKSHLTPEERDMLASLRFGDLRRSVKLPASRIQHYLRTVALLRALVEEKDEALAIIARMPCLTYLLGEDNPDDPCGCACCRAKPAFALTEEDMRK